MTYNNLEQKLNKSLYILTAGESSKKKVYNVTGKKYKLVKQGNKWTKEEVKYTEKVNRLEKRLKLR